VTILLGDAHCCAPGLVGVLVADPKAVEVGGESRRYASSSVISGMCHEEPVQQRRW
jgi:hypothetical protein